MRTKTGDVFSWVYHLAGLSFCFFIGNLPLMFCLTFLEWMPQNGIYFYLGLLPFGINLAVMFHLIEQLRVDGSLSIVKDYAVQFIKQAKQGGLVWGGYTALLFILLINLSFFRETDFVSILLPAYGILAVLALAMVINHLFVMGTATEPQSLVTLTKHVFYFGIRKGYITIFNVFILTLWLVVIAIRPVVGGLFVSGIFSFILYKNSLLVFGQQQD